MIASSRNYAIGMVHFMVGGGWKVIGIIAAAYTSLFFAGVALFYYGEYMLEPDHMVRAGLSDLAKFVIGLLMGIQGLALLLIGGYRVSSSIRHDISSRMLESHRLMPISNTNAVWGYLFGPTTPVIVFALLNLVLSCAFGALQGASLPRLVINQAVIFGFALFCWSIIALSTFIYRHMFFIALACVFLGTCTGIIFWSFSLFPAFALIMTPFLGETIFSIGGPTGDPFDEGHAFGMAGQVAFFLIFFFGACRLYRGAHRTVFNELQALALLAIWALLSGVGIYFSDRIGLQTMFNGHGSYDDTLGTIQVTASVASSALLSIIPLWSFIHEQPRRATHPLITLGAVIICGILAALPAGGAGWMQTYNIPNLLITLAVALLQVIVIYFILRLARNLHFLLATLLTGAVLLCLWILPLVIELARIVMFERNQDDHSLSLVGTFSPLGYLGALWSGNKNLSPVPGIVGQIVFAGIVALIAFALSTRKPKSAPAHP